MGSEPPSPPQPASGYPPADLRRRLLARLCDALSVAVPFALLCAVRRPVAATLCAAALVLCGDRLFGPGRSLGKRLAGLRVVVLRTRQAGGITASMRRNALFALALLPAVAGTSAALDRALAAMVAVAIIETAVALAVLTRDLGRRRLGDLFAGTQVIDASIPLGLGAPVLAPPSRAATAAGISHRHAARPRPPRHPQRRRWGPPCASP